MFRGMLDRAMRHYEGADPVIRMKAKFFFLAYLLVMAVIPIAIAYSACSHNYSTCKSHLKNIYLF